MEHPDAIAILLAARHVPDICGLADYQKAQELIESDPDLRAEFEAERAYYDQHEEMLANVRLPESVRATIREKMRAAQAEDSKVLFFPKRALAFAAAAAVLIMVGGLIFTQMSSGPEVVAQSGAELESLQTFAADQVAQRALDLDQHSDQPQELIAWLQGQGAPVSDEPPESLKGMSTMGCKVYDWNGHQVALVCFRTSAAEVVHLFVADRDIINVASAEQQAGSRRVHGRETLSWLDGEHAFVLVAHDEGQSLTGLSG